MAVTAITERLAALNSRMAAAAARSGRPASAVTLVAVSKTHSPETLQAARLAGLTEFGENYPQEAVAKITQLHDGFIWHFIGGIQSNKTRAIATHFHWAQTVASAKIAARLSAQRPFHAGALQLCIQVSPEPADGRGGVPEREIPELARQIGALERVKLRGLMFMPHAQLPEAELRAEFRRVRSLFDRLRAAGWPLDTLSMGMSEDLEIAIEEGSTMVRIGTALFGERGTAVE